MRYLMKLAIKNLWRQKRRTLLTCIALAVGLVTYIQVDSLMTGIDSMSIDNLIRLETGEIKVHSEGYFEDRKTMPIDNTIKTDKVLQSVRGVDGVKGAAPRILFSGRLNTGWEEIPISAVGIDSVEDAKVFEVQKYVEGRMPARGAMEAVLGRDLARVLELNVGDMFTLVTKTSTEALQALDLIIVGLVTSPHPQINQSTVYVPFDVAASGLALEGRATEIAVSLDDGVNLVGAKERIEQAIPSGTEVFTWKEAAEEFIAISGAKRSFNGMFLMMIMLIATVGVVNTILLGAMERKREIGMMKAMGMSEKEIVRTFMFEAIGIGVLGSLLGCVIGIGSNLYLVHVGFDITAAMGDLDVGYPVTGSIYGAWNWGTILGAFVFGVLVSLLASYVPAKKAAAKDPVQSLRRA